MVVVVAVVVVLLVKAFVPALCFDVLLAAFPDYGRWQTIEAKSARVYDNNVCCVFAGKFYKKCFLYVKYLHKVS